MPANASSKLSPRTQGTLQFLAILAAVISGVLCATAAYINYDSILIAIGFLVAATTAQLAFQHTALASKKHWGAPILALVLLAMALTPIDASGASAGQTLIAAAKADTQQIAEESRQIANVVSEVAAQRDYFASQETSWRQRAAAEKAGTGPSGNGSGEGTVYHTATSIADQLRSSVEVLDGFIAVAKSNSDLATKRVHELRTLTSDKRKNLLEPDTETVFHKRRLAVEEALQKVLASAEEVNLTPAILGLESPTLGAPSADLNERALEQDTLVGFKAQASILAATLRDLQLSMETDLPTEVTSYTVGSPFERVLKHPEGAVGFLILAGALHVAQILILLLLIRVRDEKDIAADPIPPAAGTPIPSEDKPALRAV